MSALEDVIAVGLAPEWDHRLERLLFGSDDPGHIAETVGHVVRESLGASVTSGLRYHASVSATVGIEVESGDRLAVKFIRPDRSEPWTAAIEVQRAALAAGIPTPEPLIGPLDFDTAVVVIDTWLDPGPPDRPDAATTRRALAAGLHALIEAARPLVGTAGLLEPLATVPDSAYATPHDLRFDFESSSAGAEWIDELNAQARLVLADEPADAIGHVDWRGGNVVVVGGRLAAVYDWDSAAIGSEAMLVGMASPGWSLAWEWGQTVHPDVAATEAFVGDYEVARGRPFDPYERSVIRAAQIAQLAYTARCEHSDRELGVIPGPERPFADRLRELAVARPDRSGQ